MKSRKERIELAELVLLALQGDIDEEQSQCLRQILENDPDAISLCTDLLEIYSELSPFGHVRITPSLKSSDRTQCDDLNSLIQMLAEEEKSSPVKIIEKQAPEELVMRLEKSVVQKKINKAFLWATLASTAALLMLIAYFNLSFFQPVEVATVSDSIGAKYASETFAKGSRLTNRTGRYYLEEGISSIQFDSGAGVVIEAPAEFELKSEDKMVLYAGRLYANVPKQAIGFTVKTLDSTVVDLGTEFGIYAVPMHGTELHVFKGKTQMVLWRSNAVLVTEGQAQRVEASSGRVQTIALEESRFVRKVNSENGLVWRGQRCVSLSDLVMGGDGYGSSLQTYAYFDPNTDNPIAYNGQYNRVTNDYKKITSNPFLDGIFVPNGRNQVISSEGHVFVDCPQTSGLYFSAIRFDREAKYFPHIQDRYEKDRHLSFAESMIFMHSNLGLTIDLNSVRRQFPGQEVCRFRTTAGTAFTSSMYGQFFRIQEWAPGATDFDVWVLVDGQLRSSHTEVRWDSLIDIGVPVTSSDRFLSIIVTDGEAVHVLGCAPNHYDFCSLADPRFEVEILE